MQLRCQTTCIYWRRSQMSIRCSGSARAVSSTAREINRLLNRVGEFWQVDQFDHLVRSEEQFRALSPVDRRERTHRRIEGNEYPWFTKNLGRSSVSERRSDVATSL